MKTPTWKDCLWAAGILVIVMIIAAVQLSHTPTPPTQGTNVNIDSLIEANDSIKVVIQIIDSVKNEEVEKVLTLSNDSTLELFKQLVSE